LLQGSDFAKQFDQQSFKLGTAQSRKARWRQHMMQRIHQPESGQAKNAFLPGVLPLTP